MRVDVVTAVHAVYAEFLPAAWESLRVQSHRDWTWLVQVDGPATEVLDVLSRCGALEHPRVYLEINGTLDGPAITRNVALGRATAPLLHSLDADDELEPHALEVLTEALRTHSHIGYAVGRVRDLLPTGELKAHHLPLAAGELDRGALIAEWTTGDGRYRLPVHPAGVIWRRSLLISLGGWSALRGMEDTGLLMAASAACPGVLLDSHTHRYRKHPAQRSTQPTKFRGGGVKSRLSKSEPKSYPQMISCGVE